MMICVVVVVACAATRPQSFIDEVNDEYEGLHRSFEEQFWGTKMALADPALSVDELTRTKSEMEAFLADEVGLCRPHETAHPGSWSRLESRGPT
jgi:hypothetical protein